MMLYVTRAMVVLITSHDHHYECGFNIHYLGGFHEVAVGSIRVGDMMAFMQYSMQIFFAFLMMSAMFILFPRASVSAERIAEVLNKEVVFVTQRNPFIYPSRSEERSNSIMSISSIRGRKRMCWRTSTLLQNLEP